MASTVENLYMITDTFTKGIEVLGILRDQLLKEMEKNRSRESKVAVYDASQVGKDGKITFGFAGMEFYIKIRVKFRSQRGFNQYDGLLDWGIHHTEGLERIETVKVTNEYKWTEKRIFLVESIDGSTKSHVIKDEGNIYDCSAILKDNLYRCLPDSMKSKEIE